MTTERLISADSHVNPTKDLWTREAPERLKNRVPRVESTPQGDFWVVDSEITGGIGLDAVAGRRPEEFKAVGLGYKDMRPGSYDPTARLEDMDLDGVEAEVLYFGGPVTQYPADPVLRRYIVSRYNDWMVELSRAAPTRLVGLGHVALVDVDEATSELTRIAKLGLRGFHVDPYPDERGGKPLWDPSYEPFWALVAETGLRLWHGLGAVYVGLPCLAMLWIRGDAQPGLDTLLWTLALVWSVDTGAYLAGRTIGGPRLAPSISPKKTWAGFVGGLLAAALVGVLGALWLGLQNWWPLAVIAAVLAVVEQGGDLAESAFKRRFGVKDSSNLIPGHGGVLDRVDGLLTVLVAVAGLMIVTKGGVGTWQ